MSGLMNRRQALELLESHVESEALVKHSLATEAVMRALARRLSRDEDLWGIAGLLHDLDFETTKDDPSSHGRVTGKLLADAAATHPLPVEAVQAILSHNAEALGLCRSCEFGKALTAAETLTGLVVATALVYPDKKLESVKPSSVTKRMKQPAFARNVNREHIRICEEIGVQLDEFVAIGLEAMKSVASDLGL